MTASEICELCAEDGGIVLMRAETHRVVRVESAEYPGFCRVIANRHAREMSDLSPVERDEILAAVFVVETVVRRILNPDKVNLASLGNVTPHVHWHVIPRWRSDVRFPDPIWGPPSREGRVPTLPGEFDHALTTELRNVPRRR